MKLSNRKKTNVYRFILTFINVCIVVGFILLILEYGKLRRFPFAVLYFIVGAIICLLLFLRIGKPIFEYDSDGEALVLKNRGVWFLQKDKQDEFPKYKLLNFEIASFLFIKRLYLSIKSRKYKKIMLQYNITYLSKKEIRDLKTSLNRVIEHNKQEGLI